MRYLSKRTTVPAFRRLLICLFALSITFLSSVEAETVIPGGSVEGVWAAEGSPYLIEANITLGSEKSLTLGAGTVVKFALGTSLYVYDGMIVSQGTSEEPVYLTSILDGSVGGNTAPEGETSDPQPGD